MLKTAKLVGASSVKTWSQVHVFFPDKRKRHLGVMLAAVGVGARKEQVDLSQFGPEVIRRLHEAYYGESEFEGLDRLKRALGKIGEEFGKVRLSVVSGVVVADRESNQWVLYAGGLGKVGVEIWRDGSLVSLISSGEGGVSGVSGFLRKDDVVILGTQELFSSIRGDEFEEALKLKSVEAVVDELAPIVHSKDSSLVAGVLLGVSDKVKESGKTEAKDDDGAGRIQTAEKIVVGKKGKRKAPLRTARFVIAGVASRWWEKLRQKKRTRSIGKLHPDISPEKKKRKLIGTVLLLLVFLLAVSVGFGFVRQRTSEEQKRFREVEGKVERLMRESQELVDLNPLRARALLAESKEIVASYVGENKPVPKRSEGWVEAKTLELKKQLETLLKIYEAPAEVFLDLNLVREGSSGVEIDFDGEELLVLDKDADVVLAVGVDDKKSGVVGGGDLLRGAVNAAVYFGRGFVLSDRGVVELQLKRKTSAVVVERDEAWGEIGEVEVFGGNLYLLDKQRRQIYRYSGIDGGFGSKREWLGPGVRPDFSKVVSMAIDGSIWILTETGKIEVYTQGTGVGFEVLGLDELVSSPQAIYTDEESERIYILDKGNRRVVVVDKEGQYVAQYKWEGIAGVSDMVVAEKEGKILLLSDNIIYEIGLR